MNGISQIGLPLFPEFAPIGLEFHDSVDAALSGAPDGVSEFTFAGLYLFRRRYSYRVSRGETGNLIISGSLGDKKFFSTPRDLPRRDDLEALFDSHDYWKNIPLSILEPNREKLASWGIDVAEDRDNFDYLYNTKDLAYLSGKKFHKKRNLVNAFELTYRTHRQTALTPELVPDAMKVLEKWRALKGEEGDYIASKEALELMDDFGFTGLLVYINGNPAAYCLGELLPNGNTFAMHFEKGVDSYKGVYQFVNQAYARVLAEEGINGKEVLYINREQDLGEEGMRQAKETYRPVGFVKKHVGARKSFETG
jgi:hypothetical protein